MQGIALQIATDHAASSHMHPILAAFLVDRRLFHVPGMLPVLEGALPVAWARLSAEDRGRVLSNIEAVATSPHYYRGSAARKALLAGLPGDALTPEQGIEAEAYREEELQRTERHRKSENVPEKFTQWRQGEEDNRAVQDWPEPADRDQLKRFHALYFSLLDPAAEAVTDKAIQAQTLILDLLPSITAHLNAADGENTEWLWHALRVLLETLRKPGNAKTKDSEPLLRQSAELALRRLEAGAGPRIQEASSVSKATAGDSGWMSALELANEA
jgi:hypothetical protein